MGAMISTTTPGDYNAAFKARNPLFALQHDGSALLESSRRRPHAHAAARKPGTASKRCGAIRGLSG